MPQTPQYRPLAGRALFNVSRTERAKVNDSDRFEEILQRFGLEWGDILIEWVRELILIASFFIIYKNKRHQSDAFLIY